MIREVAFFPMQFELSVVKLAVESHMPFYYAPACSVPARCVSFRLFLHNPDLVRYERRL
jgi:hypothetical protein